MKIFQNDWEGLLADEMKKPYYQELRRFLIEEYRTRRIFPDMYAIFNALHYTSYAETKVVILGQDPYHGEGQAHGLSFSVQAGRRSRTSSRSFPAISAAGRRTTAASRRGQSRACCF